MSDKEFIIQLIDKLIWPFSLFIILFLARKPISILIPHVTKAKFKDLEFEFDRTVKTIAADVEKALPVTVKKWKNKLFLLTASSPTMAVLEAWKMIEEKSIQLLESNVKGVTYDQSEKYKKIGGDLQEHQLIDIAKKKIFDDLRILRNKVAHAKKFDVNQKQAVSYVTSAVAFIDYLEEINLQEKQVRSITN